jgi:hypothetical protein
MWVENNLAVTLKPPLPGRLSGVGIWVYGNWEEV